MKKIINLFLYPLLGLTLALGVLIIPQQTSANPSESSIISRPECIYSSRKIIIFGCVGSTNNLCKGSADCPTNQIEAPELQ